MLNVANKLFAECCFAECRYAEWLGALFFPYHLDVHGLSLASMEVM
jgi:hypothetical protein